METERPKLEPITPYHREILGLNTASGGDYWTAEVRVKNHPILVHNDSVNGYDIKDEEAKMLFIVDGSGIAIGYMEPESEEFIWIENVNESINISEEVKESTIEYGKKLLATIEYPINCRKLLEEDFDYC